MTRETRRRFLVAAVLVVVAAGFGVEIATAAPAAGPFGVGAPETSSAGSGAFFAWVAEQQSRFYRSLTAAVKALKTDPVAVVGLVGLSFAYGVAHAAGPGHGKAVIASYVVANGETARRGVFLAFVSAFLQAAVAIVFVGAASALLKLTSIAMTEATQGLELASAVLVTGLGLWLVGTKVMRIGRPRPTAAVVEPTPGPAPTGAASTRFGGHRHGPDCRHPPIGTTAATEPGFVCTDCGHSHAPDPRDLAGPMSIRRALSAVFAVGIRPCTGAVIVLVFAFSQGLYWAGALSALAMAVGTGLTVALLATLAVSAKSIAVGLAGGDGVWGRRILRGAEVLGAVVILSMGIVLLGASLTGRASAF